MQNTGLSVVSIVGEGAAGVSRLPVSVPQIQVTECTTGVLASHAVIRNLGGRGQRNEAGAPSCQPHAPCGGIHGCGMGRKHPKQ